MASKSGATTLECTYCSKQYTEGEGEKTVFGNYKCKVKRSGQKQERYHPGEWVRCACALQIFSSITIPAMYYCNVIMYKSLC